MAPQDLWLKKDGTRSSRYGRGKRWRVSYVDPHTGKPRNPSFARKAEAERFENNIKADISRGKYVDPALGRTTVGEYGEGYCRRFQGRENTRRQVNSRFKNHIKPVLGHLPMSAVRSAAIQDWISQLQHRESPLAASTIRTTYNSLLFPMFKRAAIDGVIGFNPCVGIVLPELPEGEYDLPTPAQVLDIGTGLGEYYEPVAYVGSGCGLRTGEVFGLELSSVDFLRRKLRVRQQLVMSARGVPYLGPPKTKTSRRDVDLPEIVLHRLSAHIKQHPPVEVSVWDRTNPSRPIERKARLLFLEPGGQPMRSPTWARIWASGVERAGLPGGVYTMRSLRHFFATMLIYAGKNVKTVQMAMGHAKATVTLETYLGYWPNDERDGTATVIDSAFQALADLTRTESVPAWRT
jgi:integrase